MNSINLVGRITKDLELRSTPNDNSVCEFSLAVNRIGSEVADFINCQVWNKQAENCKNYLNKNVFKLVQPFMVSKIDGVFCFKKYFV